jgi:hypothetical protein
MFSTRLADVDGFVARCHIKSEEEIRASILNLSDIKLTALIDNLNEQKSRSIGSMNKIEL